METEDQIEAGIQPDAPEDLQTLESLIAADEAADAAQTAGGQQRDTATGKFTKQGASANSDAPRAGERLTPDEIKATPGAAKANGKVAGNGVPPKTTQQAGDNKQQDQTNQQQAAGEPQGGKDGKGSDPDSDKTPYRRETERRERSWQELNKQKEQFKAEREAFELEKQTVTAREQAVQRRNVTPRLNGYTADEYAAAAPKFEARALELERLGEFDKADEQRQMGENAKAAAEQLRRQQPPVQAGVQETWTKLKGDLPEALNVNNPLNRELRALIQQRPDLLGDEAGPYRVAVLAGRKLVAGLEQELNRHKAESAKVPELLQQVESLTARVQELEAMTSPAGDGGGGAANRGNGRGDNFADMSTAQQERAIERELAGVL